MVKGFLPNTHNSQERKKRERTTHTHTNIHSGRVTIHLVDKLMVITKPRSYQGNNMPMPPYPKKDFKLRTWQEYQLILKVMVRLLLKQDEGCLEVYLRSSSTPMSSFPASPLP